MVGDLLRHRFWKEALCIRAAGPKDQLARELYPAPPLSSSA
jgi:hypothetical protein